MDSTLDKRIAAMRGSLMNTALEAAESRGQRLAGVAHVLYALYRDDGFAGRLLRAHGLESAEIRRLMGTVPNMPLADGGKPVPNLSTRRILKHANDTLEVLRYLQGNDQVAGLLASHGIGKPDRQPTQAQVLAAAQAGIEAAGPLALGRDYGEAAVKVEKPRTLKDEIKHVWGLGDITCNDTGGDIDFASSKTRLPDGDSSCVAYRKDGIVEVVAHADSGKLGLYRKSDGKPLRSVGKD